MDGKMEKRDEEMRKMMSATERVTQGGSVSQLEVKEEANEQEFKVSDGFAFLLALLFPWLIQSSMYFG